MKLTDLIFWLVVVTVATGSTTEVLDRIEYWLGRTPAQPVSIEKKPETKPTKKDPNDIQTEW